MSGKFRRVSDDFWVAPQMTTGDIADAAAMGVKLIINNRPDGEAPDQPASPEVEAAARAAGLGYAHIPIGAAGITPDKIAAFEKIMADHEHGPALAFCASGMRSLLVRAYALAHAGKPVAMIISQAAAAGYNIAAYEPALTIALDAGKAP